MTQMAAFKRKGEVQPMLDGQSVAEIYSDLSTFRVGIDLTLAKKYLRISELHLLGIRKPGNLTLQVMRHVVFFHCL